MQPSFLKARHKVGFPHGSATKRIRLWEAEVERIGFSGARKLARHAAYFRSTSFTGADT